MQVSTRILWIHLISFLSLPLLSIDSRHYWQGFMDPPELGSTSYLPIIKINTNGQPILDDPDIVAAMQIIHNDNGQLNSIFDPPTEYDGLVNIEIRGESSQSFPKKSYAVETIDASGNDLDVSFLGFPPEEDWVFHGPYSDKSLMRNVLSMYAARRMGQYASRTQFFELYLNDQYEGVYVLMERIKRDPGRVDIAKLNPEDIAGDELTGGYIIRIDKGEPDWFSNYSIVNVPGLPLTFQYVYPNSNDIQPEQEQYIRSYVDSFENAIASSSYTFAGKRYDEYIDLTSFAQSFLLNELTKNVDGYRLSTYLHKQKDSDGGKLYHGPAWDFNLSLYNADYCAVEDPIGWMYYTYCDNGNPFWWDRMFNDSLFNQRVSCLWEEYRQTWLREDSLFAYMDDRVAELGAAADRNFERWDILGQYVWPNPQPFAVTYAEEIARMKDWLSTRLVWMDSNLPGTCIVNTQTVIGSNDLILKVNPNPSPNLALISLSSGRSGPGRLFIYDALGRLLQTWELQLLKNEPIELEWDPLTDGLYFIFAERGDIRVGKQWLRE